MSLLVAALVVELAARLVLPPPRFHQSPLELDAELGFRAIPAHRYRFTSPLDAAQGHEVAFDDDGLRGRALPLGPPADGIERIVFLGDSFLVAEAVPAESMLTRLVEAALVSKGRRAEVYNLSTVDYGTGQQILLLDRFAARLAPTIVVLALYPANDVANNALALAGRTQVSPGDAIRPYLRARNDGDLDVAWATPRRAFARRHSRAFATIERGFFAPRVGPERPRSTEERLTEGDPPREFLEVFRDHPFAHPWERDWRDTESLILALRDRCAALGARLHVVVLPSEPQVVATPQSIAFEIESAAAGRSLAEMIDWNVPERRLARFFAREGIASTPMLEPFRRATAGGALLFTRDRHLNETGHAIVAKSVAEALLATSSGGLPDDDPPRGAGLGADAPGDREPHEWDAAEASGQPVDWPAQEAPNGLDLRWVPHSERFSDGWLVWQPASASYPGGWRVGRRGIIALQAADGDLVLRGYAVAPLALELGFVGGGPVEQRRVESPGLFELRMRLDARPRRSASGHVALLVDVGDTIGGLIVQQIGFVRDTRRAERSPVRAD